MKYSTYFFLLFISFSTATHAQDQDSIRISGVVISADSLQHIPNATIRSSEVFTRYQTDSSGYFSIFAYPADTLTFSALGYRTGIFVVPQSLNSSSYSLVETLFPDSLASSQVSLFPMPSAEEFIRAFKDKKPLYTDKYEAMRRNIESVDKMEDEEAFLSKYQPININFGYGRLYNNSYGPIPGNNFLNPVRWSNFINDLQQRTFDDEID